MRTSPQTGVAIPQGFRPPKEGNSFSFQFWMGKVFPSRQLVPFNWGVPHQCALLFATTSVIRGIATPACALVRNDSSLSTPTFYTNFSPLGKMPVLGETLGMGPSWKNALCHPVGIFHKAVELWKTSVEKPVENVENFDFSTAIFLPPLFLPLCKKSAAGGQGSTECVRFFPGPSKRNRWENP